MIRLRRVWYNFVAEYHQERQLDHARRRDSALRKLEQIERRRHRRQVQQDIHKILDRRGISGVATRPLRPADLEPEQPAYSHSIDPIVGQIIDGIDGGWIVAPTGYLACDGSAVSRTTYAALFAKVGTRWGVGDGSTTFNVPDLRRKTGSGGSGTGTLGNAVGNSGLFHDIH